MAEKFKEHMMYDAKKAETHKEHLELKRKGYGHDKSSFKMTGFPEHKGVSPGKEYVSAGQRKAVWASKEDGGEGNPNKMVSPAKGKLKPCQKTAAKKKFKVYPSAYANMWASNHKC